MVDRRTSRLKICGWIIEVAIRLLVKISSVLAGYATAIALHKNTADLTGSLISGIGTVGAFAVLRPVAYRLYPKLRRSDLRRAKRGPNPTTLTALGVLVLLLVTFITNVWFGIAVLSMLAAGALVASAVVFCDPARP
jgi:hypothetical protein